MHRTTMLKSESWCVSCNTVCQHSMITRVIESTSTVYQRTEINMHLMPWKKHGSNALETSHFTDTVFIFARFDSFCPTPSQQFLVMLG